MQEAAALGEAKDDEVKSPQQQPQQRKLPALPDAALLADLRSDEERAAVLELHRRLLSGAEPVDATDPQLCVHTLVRFVRARPEKDGGLPAAEEMLRAHLKWRKSYGVDDVVAGWAKDASPKKQLLDHHWFSGSNGGKDKRGLPVHIINMGSADPAGIVRESGIDNFAKQHVYDLETMFAHAREVSMKEGKEQCACSFIEIYDLAGFEYGRAYRAIKPFKALTTILEANYPERVRKVFIINAPAVFKGIWALAKKFVPKDTSAKIKIYSKKGGWLADMEAEIDKDQIPDYLGGAFKGANIPKGGRVKKGALAKFSGGGAGEIAAATTTTTSEAGQPEEEEEDEAEVAAAEAEARAAAAAELGAAGAAGAASAAGGDDMEEAKA